MFTFGTTLITVHLIIHGLQSMSNLADWMGNFQIIECTEGVLKKIERQTVTEIGEYFDLYLDKNQILTLN